MNKYDIGVIGLWAGCNYGSIATYYALNNILKSMGKTVLMIDKPIISDGDFERSMTHSRRFAMEHYEISEQYKISDLSSLNDICDAFVIGSDQVWNYGISRNFGKEFYFDFVDENKKKIAYAVSFGHSVDFAPKEERTAISKLMKRMDGISVRESDGVRLCRDIYGIRAEHVLDPVFVANPDIYFPLIEKSSAHESEPFLATYILDPTKEKREAILRVSKKLGGIKIINLLDGMPGTFKKNQTLLNLPNCIENLQVEDWLYYIKNAQFVITDSCHGASFALIFNKRVIGIANRRRGYSRFYSLFNLLGIESHLVTDPREILSNEKLLTSINYNAVNSKLEEERKRCYNWLYNVINEPKKDLQTLDKQNSILIHCSCEEKEDVKEKSVSGKQIKCTGCGVCASLCPKNAIKMEENQEGFLNPVVDNSKCVNCGICVDKCIALHPQYKNNDQPDCYAMMAHDNVRAKSSSGGMFTVVAEHIINQDGFVCGAAYKKDFSVEHIIVNKIEDLEKLRGSKYMQSHIGDIYKNVKKLLECDHLVLFTGMPCQVAGLYSYLGRDYKRLYTIDLLCHGITSSKVFEKYHRDVLDGRELQRLEFKEKEPWGWHAGVNAYFTDGTKYSEPLETDLYFIAYLKSIAKNITCGDCNVNRLPRQGDFTIGDFWGISRVDAEMNDKKGTSVVLTNNQKAEELFDELKPYMYKVKRERLTDAINGNRIIKEPYRLHKNRTAFFENFETLNFKNLTLGCYQNDLYMKQRDELSKLIPENLHELYYIAKTAAENSRGRNIVTWTRSENFEFILSQYFDKTVEFSVARDMSRVNHTTIRSLDELRDAKGRYYVVALHPDYNQENYSQLEQYGLEEIKDFIFRKHRPTVLTNYDCSKGRYSDVYGNTIDGWNAIIGKVVFNGCNNHIVLGKDVGKTENLILELSSNAIITIHEKTRFNAETKFQVIGYNGQSNITIMNDCRFTDALFRLYNHEQTTSVCIGEKCSFESKIEFHANAGKKIIIGRDCMFSHDIDLWAGDGHTIFEIETGKNINSDYHSLPEYKNKLVLGEHVWVSKGAFIMHGTAIGNGCVVGAKSVVKGVYPNNCTIAGNPAAIIRKNIAWSREMVAMDMHRQCGGEEYVKLTESEQKNERQKDVVDKVNILVPLGGVKQDKNKTLKNWLITGGSTGLGQAFALKLLSLGYTVAATSRDITKLDHLPDEIIKIQVDVRNLEDCKRAVSLAIEKMGWIDVVVNNAGISHMSTFEETPLDVGDAIMETNYWGVSNMLKAVIPHMRQRRSGTVINISSASGFRARNYGSYYVASKFAVENLTKNLKFECQRFMRFMSVELGGLNTGLNKRQTVIHTKIEEYKNLPPLYPFKKGYSNKIDKAVNAIINTACQDNLPRDLILGWDAYQQFPKALEYFEKETEKYKEISISTDEAKRDKINLEDVILPRNKNLKIQNWLITGGSGGFGKVLALQLLKLGYTVAVTSRDISKLDEFPDEIIKIESNLDSMEACEKAVKTAIEKMGSLDVLVNNATSNCWCSFEECPDDIMEKVFYVNFTIPQYMMKAVIPYMRKNKNGTVVNISSIAGIQPRARVTTYSAAKAALEGITRVLKSECQRFARFMAVELVCMRTQIMIHNPVYDSKIADYQNLGRYSHEINNIPNRKDIAAQQIINVVNQEDVPQSLLIGTESYLIAKNEIQKARKEYREYKDFTLSICAKINKEDSCSKSVQE